MDKRDRKINNKPRSGDAREQSAIDCLNSAAYKLATYKPTILKGINFKLDGRSIDNLEAVDSFPETTDLIRRWRDIVKPCMYRMTGGKWKENTSQSSHPVKGKKLKRDSTNYQRL